MFDYSPVSAEDGWDVTFDASASTGDIESYTWEFSDVTSIEDAGPTVEFIPFFEEETLAWTKDLPDCSECNEFSPGGESGVIAVGEQPAAGTLKAVNLTESAVLDTSAIALPAEPVSFTPDTYTPSAEFALETVGGGGGGGGGGGDPPPDPDWPEYFQISASPFADGQIPHPTISDAATTRNNEFTEYSDAPDPDLERGSVWDVHSSDAVDEEMYINLTEGQDTQEYYSWINAEAILEDAADSFALEDGWVDWRDFDDCMSMSGCHDEPTAVVDFLETTSIEWSSSVSMSDPEAEAAIYAEGNNGALDSAGRHSYEFSYNVSGDTLDRDYIYGAIIIEATIDEDAHSSIDEELDSSTSIPTEIETDDEEDPLE